MLYVGIAITITFLFYFAPAQALFPRLMLSSRTAPGIPVVSLFIVVTLYTFLSYFSLSSQIVMLSVLGLFGVIAILRTVKTMVLEDTVWQWPRSHVLLLIFLLALSALWAVRLGTTGFDRGDEIYSWNLWAIQHWLGHDIDFYYTRAPYPQFLPVFLASTYELFGHFDYQMPTKLTLAILPLSAWYAIMVSPRSTCSGVAVLSAVLGLVLLVAVGREFSTGLADPLVASAITLTVYFFILFRRSPDQASLLYLSLTCGAVAIFAKQPGLIWSLLSFPLIVGLMVFRKKAQPSLLFAPFLLAALAVYWLLVPGQGFADNEGVTTRSLRGMEWYQVVWDSFLTWGVGKPLLLILLLGALFAVSRKRDNLDIYCLFLIPALLLWWIYGSYHLRLGAHTITVAALLIAASGYPFANMVRISSKVASKFSDRFAKSSLSGFMLFSLVIAVAVSYERTNRYGPEFDWQKPSENALYLQMGESGREAFRLIAENPSNVFWVASNYVYGVFYGHVTVSRPVHISDGGYTVVDLLDQIMDERPDYLMDVGLTPVAFGPGSNRLHQLASDDCPFLFEPLFDVTDRAAYQLYRFVHDREAIALCKENIL